MSDSESADEDIVPAAVPAGSSLGRLASRRAELAAGRPPLDLEVPGYSGELWVRYKFVAYRTLAKVGVKLQGERDEARRNLLACIDTLVACCEEILTRDADGALVGLADELGGGGPVTLGDPRLASVLEFEASSAREIVQGVFANDFAIIAQAGEVSEWLSRESPEVDRALMGEA